MRRLLPVEAKSQTAITLPSVPATMATDVPQRMADGSLFVPKATQHLLSVRTVMTARVAGAAHRPACGHCDRRSQQLRSGADRSCRAASRRPKRGLAFVGKRVEKGEVLAFCEHHIEAYNKGNLQGEIAELEARIALQERSSPAI